LEDEKWKVNDVESNPLSSRTPHSYNKTPSNEMCFPTKSCLVYVKQRLSPFKKLYCLCLHVYTCFYPINLPSPYSLNPKIINEMEQMPLQNS